jgi:lambda repressor-like predicted transcriptional regulator
LTAAYQAGSSVYQLAENYKVRCDTVSAILKRNGIPRRYRLIQGELLKNVAQFYSEGNSLATIATEVGFSREAVRNALQRDAFEPTRPLALFLSGSCPRGLKVAFMRSPTRSHSR